MNKYSRLTALVAPFVTPIAFLSFAEAQEGFQSPEQEPYEPGALPSGLGISSNASIIDFIAAIINIVLSLVGLILILIFLYGAVQYMTAGSDKNQVENAQNVLQNAVIGSILLALVYVFANFLLTIVAAG